MCVYIVFSIIAVLLDLFGFEFVYFFLLNHTQSVEHLLIL